MASAVALVSVVTSGVVAITVPLVTSRLHRSQRMDDRRAERFDELRAVVDAASIALARAESTLEALEAAVERTSRDSSDDADVAGADATAAAATVAIGQVAESSHRAAARLGWLTQPCRLYRAACNELKAELALLIDVRDGGPSSDDLEVWAEVVRSLRETRARYEAHRHAFYAAVSPLVGPDVT